MHDKKSYFQKTIPTLILVLPFCKRIHSLTMSSISSQILPEEFYFVLWMKIPISSLCIQNDRFFQTVRDFLTSNRWYFFQLSSCILLVFLRTLRIFFLMIFQMQQTNFCFHVLKKVVWLKMADLDMSEHLRISQLKDRTHEVLNQRWLYQQLLEISFETLDKNFQVHLNCQKSRNHQDCNHQDWDVFLPFVYIR